MLIEKKVRTYVLENYLFTDDESALLNDDSFLQKGILDSTGVLEMISFLEEEFGLVVDDEELLPENFDSVNRIVGFVAAKQAAAQQTQAEASSSGTALGGDADPLCQLG